MLPPPAGTKFVGVYQKPPNAGARGAVGGFRRDFEMWYLIGPWPTGIGGRSSVIATRAPTQGNPHSPQGRYGHPHAKPLDVMEQLITACRTASSLTRSPEVAQRWSPPATSGGELSASRLTSATARSRLAASPRRLYQS